MKRILIVEDDIYIREMIRFMLEFNGYEVEEAPDGKVAMRLHQKEPADLIITDIIMPDKEGLETIIELCRDFPDVKIIAMSGGGHCKAEDYIHLAKSFGAHRTFIKPFKLKEMLKVVEELLGNKEKSYC